MTLVQQTNHGPSATGPLVNLSGAITLGGTAQVLAAEMASRRFFLFQNISAEAMWINFGATAVADTPSIRIPAGATFTMEGSWVAGDEASLIAATTGSKFVCKVG